MEHLKSSPVTATEIKKDTAHDPILERVLLNVLSGWPESSCNDEEIKPFWSKWTELLTQQGCLLWGSCVVVPPSLPSSIVKELHDTHPHMKSFGRMLV